MLERCETQQGLLQDCSAKSTMITARKRERIILRKDRVNNKWFLHRLAFGFHPPRKVGLLPNFPIPRGVPRQTCEPKALFRRDLRIGILGKDYWIRHFKNGLFEERIQASWRWRKTIVRLLKKMAKLNLLGVEVPSPQISGVYAYPIS